MDMQILYDSDKFVVVHMMCNQGQGSAVRDPRHGFEIINKAANKEVFLVDSWATAFQRRINAWQINVPTQDEVEEELDGYTQLAQISVEVQ